MIVDKRKSSIESHKFKYLSSIQRSIVFAQCWDYSARDHFAFHAFLIIQLRSSFSVDPSQVYNFRASSWPFTGHSVEKNPI